MPNTQTQTIALLNFQLQQAVSINSQLMQKLQEAASQNRQLQQHAYQLANKNSQLEYLVRQQQHQIQDLTQTTKSLEQRVTQFETRLGEVQKTQLEINEAQDSLCSPSSPGNFF